MSCFWEVVPKAGRFFFGIVGPSGPKDRKFEYRRYKNGI